MKSLISDVEQSDDLAFNLNDISYLASEIGYPPDTINFHEPRNILIDMGNNFVAEVIDLAKMLAMGGKLTSQHFKKALRLKFGIEVDGPIEDFNVIKRRNMESDKVDEKLNK